MAPTNQNTLTDQGEIFGLNGLRALSIILVFFFHLHFLNLGWIGVQIFFVISGYLISAILIADRHQPLTVYLKQFYIRRALRIFPLVFSYLAIIYLLDVTRLVSGIDTDGMGYLVTFTYNFFNAFPGYQGTRFSNHLWSLSVEEQFYLFWPFVIYFVPARWLAITCGCLIVAGPLLRYGIFISNPFDTERAGNAVYVLTSSHLDAFATGALIAQISFSRRVRLAIFVLGVLLLIPWINFGTLESLSRFEPGSTGIPILGVWEGLGSSLWIYTALNLLAAVLILQVQERRFASALFGSRVMYYLGSISFGFYVYHNPVQELYTRFLKSSSGYELLVLVEHWPKELIFALLASIQFGLVVITAALSYKLIEGPFLKLKQRWAPRQRTRGTEPGVAT